MNIIKKKYITLALTLALFGTVGLGTVTAYADESVEQNDTITETPDVPKKVAASSPFADLENVNKLPFAGDIDGDGDVSSNDALTVLRASVALHENNIDRYFAGDVDGDGSLSVLDALKILRKSVGFNEDFENKSMTGVKWFKDGNDYFAESYDGIPLEGIVIIDDVKCGFDENGKLLTGTSKVGEKYFDFLSNGVLLDGWQYSENGKSYYHNGTKLDGWQNIFGLNYYFENGISVTGWKNFDKIRAYFDDSGIASIGWTIIDGKTYYFDRNLNAVDGLTTISGRKYYLYTDGDFATGWKTIEEKNFYFCENGAAALGFTVIDGNTYYFIDENTLADGFCNIDGKDYYFDSNNIMQTGWKTIDGDRYFFTEDGSSAVGEHSIDGTNYMFGSDGKFKTGFITLDGNTYYNNEYGYRQYGWHTINGEKYYFNSDGSGADGFLTLDGNMYCFDQGKMLRNTTVKLYKIDGNGICTKITTITGELAKYRAEEIISSIGTDPNDICSYIISHVNYYFVNVPQVYSNPYAADWADISAYAMNRGYGACYHFAAYMDQLFHAAGYKSRIIVGTGMYPSLHCWNQIYINGAWINYDGVNAIYAASDNYLRSFTYTFDNYVTPNY